MFRLLFIVSVLLCYTSVSFAFPEMIRHGYINCTACHVSPAGGGLMSTYGRSMSKEILSRWSYEGEENIAHGLIKNEKVINWLNGSQEVGFNIGGDVRYLQTHRNSSNLEEGKFFPMQRDLEGAFRFYNLTIVATYGIQYKPGEDIWDSRRVYALYQVLESLSLRVGRFLPIFGVMIPDHYTNIKRGLGFDQGRERDNVELNYIHENWNATVTLSKSPKSLSDNLEEKAFTAQLNYALNDKYKLGVSYWHGEFELNKRSVSAAHALLGFTHDIYAISEVDYQITTKPTGDANKGLFYFQRVGYEFTRGWHGILQIDGGQSDLDLSISKSFAYGLGLNIYPRPHFEIQTLWSKASIKAVDNKPMDMAHLVLHYYF
jgi:hypothetical protein